MRIGLDAGTVLHEKGHHSDDICHATYPHGGGFSTETMAIGEGLADWEAAHYLGDLFLARYTAKNNNLTWIRTLFSSYVKALNWENGNGHNNGIMIGTFKHDILKHLGKAHAARMRCRVVRLLNKNTTTWDSFVQTYRTLDPANAELYNQFAYWRGITKTAPKEKLVLESAHPYADNATPTSTKKCYTIPGNPTKGRGIFKL